MAVSCANFSGEQLRAAAFPSLNHSIPVPFAGTLTRRLWRGQPSSRASAAAACSLLTGLLSPGCLVGKVVQTLFPDSRGSGPWAPSGNGFSCPGEHSGALGWARGTMSGFGLLKDGWTLDSFPPAWSGLWLPPEKCARSTEPSTGWSFCPSGQSEPPDWGRGGHRGQRRERGEGGGRASSFNRAASTRHRAGLAVFCKPDSMFHVSCRREGWG